MILMIDNYDSFTWNVVQYLWELGADVEVYHNDAISLAEIENRTPAGICISPGPCTPYQAGISMAVIEHFAGQLPIFGICLGHQSIASVFGGEIVRAPEVMHGKVSPIYHKGIGVFENLESPFKATRYNSLVVDAHNMPRCLEMTAWTFSGEDAQPTVMGLRHRALDIEGVQFHPESILSEHGHEIFRSFMMRCK